MSVLVAYAHTAEGQAALAHGQSLAAKEDLPLVVFDLEASSTAEDRTVSAHQPEAAPEQAPVPARWIARDHRNPDAAAELLEAADALEASLIVVGVRRRSPVGKFLLGSNAQQIIIGASVPVVAVKAAPHA